MILSLEKNIGQEIGIYLIDGSVIIGDEFHQPGGLLVANEIPPKINLASKTHLMLLGGDKLTEHRHMDWNFVHTDRQVIELAKKKWSDQKFPKIKGETEFIRLPS